MADEAVLPCSRSAVQPFAAIGDKPGDGAVGVGQVVAAVGEADELFPAFSTRRRRHDFAVAHALSPRSPSTC